MGPSEWSNLIRRITSLTGAVTRAVTRGLTCPPTVSKAPSGLRRMVVTKPSVSHGSFDSGVQSSTSANYAMEGGLGGIVGGVSNTSGSMSARSGASVPLVVMTQLVVSLAPAMSTRASRSRRRVPSGLTMAHSRFWPGATFFGWPTRIRSWLSHPAAWQALAQCGRICWGVYQAVIGGSPVAVTCWGWIAIQTITVFTRLTVFLMVGRFVGSAPA